MSPRRRGWAYAALGMLFVSTDSFFIRWSETDPWTVNLWVALFSLVFFAMLGVATGEPAPVAAVRTGRWPLVMVSAGGAITQIAFVTAVTRTSVANVVVIVAAAPVLAAVIARVFLGERTTRRVWTAIAITVVGVLMIVVRSVGEPNLDGDLLALLAILVFAATITVWRAHPELSRVAGLSGSAVLVVGVSAAAGAVWTIDGRVLLATLGMGLVFNPIGRLLHSSAPKYAPTGEVAMFMPVETVAATVWAWIAFAERPEPWTVVGGVVVIAGMLYGTVGTQRGPDPTVTPAR